MNTTRWLNLASALLLAAAAFGFWVDARPAFAAEAAPTSAEPEAATADDEVTDAEAKPSSEVFIPTEEISEDFAVSFPVDI